ncbi:MAG: glycosyltransferase family 39 protein [bacterium]
MSAMSVRQDVSSHAWGRDLCLLILLAGVLFGFMLGSRPLAVPDEGRYSEIPREMVVTGDYITPRINGVKYFEKPVLFYWLESVSIRFFGIHEWSLRLWPALFALLGVLTVYGGGRRLYGHRSGLIAGAVLSTSLLYYALSRVVILDMAMTVLLAAALLAFLLGTHEPPGAGRRLFFWGFYLFAALATMTKGLIGILIPMMVIGVWILILNEWRMLKMIYLPSGLALFLIVAAPWHILVSQANPEFPKFYFIHEHFLRYLTKIHKRYEPAWYFIPILLLGLFPWTAFLVQSIRHSLPASWRERHEHRDALFLMLWAGLVFIFFSASNSKLIPYILPIFPPLAILIGRYLAEAWDRANMPGIRSGYVILLVTALALAAAIMTEIHHLIPPETQRLLIYIKVMALILILGALFTGVHVRRGSGVPMVFASVIIISVLFLAVLNAGSVFYDRNSVKELALVLKPSLQTGDEVVCYHGYYQDLPVYLERCVTVTGWTGELKFGNGIEDVSRWMINEETFWQRWQSPATVYMLTRREIYDGLRHDGRWRFYLIAQTDENVLLCNRESRP